MKFHVLSFLLLFATGIHAQVAINTDGTAPDNSAMLHVKSTTKGLLIPSMTNSQRALIVAPGEGLIVYDLTNDLLFQYQDGTWRAMITNEYWAKNSTDIYNVNLNVGIGNANPTEKLHVTGNIRSTGDLLLSGDVRMNNPSGILQFQNAGVNTGYMQLSGSNLRMGTNSGNATGNLVLRMNGNDRITINPAGDMNIEGKITAPETGTSNLLPKSYGKVDSDGSIISGTGNFTVTNIGSGFYRITCNGLTTNSVAVITTQSSGYCPGVAHFNGYFEVVTRNINAGNLSNIGFSFIAYQ